MALALFDRVQETSTTAGTGSIILAGAVSGFQSFAVVGNGNTCYYTIVDGSAWEVGVGTYSTSGPTLARTTILSNSNGNTSPLTLTANSKSVFLTYPASKSVNLNESGNVSPLGTVVSGIWNGTTIGVAYGGTGVTASSGANSVVLRDANQNITVNRINQGIQTTTASGGTTVLTAASQFNQALVGTGGQTFRLPDATTLTDTTTFQFNNNATGTLTIQNNAGTTVGTIAPGGAAGIALLSNATVGGTWDVHAYIPENVTWGTNALALGSTVITGGTWNGGTIQPAYGGTGLTSYTSGGAVYANSSSTLTSGTLPITAGGTGNTSGQAASTAFSATFNSGGAGDASGTTFNGSAARTISYNTIGAPSTTGTNASGSWGISVTGTSSNITAYTINQNLGTGNQVTFDSVITGNNGNGTNIRLGDDAWMGDINIANTTRLQGAQNAANAYLVFGNGDNTALGRAGTGALTYGGNVVLTAGNYNSYAPTLTGGGASGTWGINVTGTSGSISGFNNPTTAPTANTIAYRDSAGDIAAREIVLSSGLSSTVPTVLVSMFPTTNQMVRTTPAAVASAIQGAASGTWGINITGSAGSAGSSTSVSATTSTGIQSSYSTTINTTTPGLANYGIVFSGPAIADYAQGITWGWSGTNAQAGIYVQSSGAYGTKMYFATTDAFVSGSKTSMSIDHVGNVNLPRGTFSNGSVWINNGANFNAYNENIRLFNAPNGVSVIGFSASGISGEPITSILGFSDRWEVRFGSGWQQRTYNGYVEAAGSFRAPIFYDSNNTTYYIDPNSISSMYGVAIRGDQSSTDTSNQIFFWGAGNTTTSAIGFKASGGYFPNPTGTGDGYNTYFTMDTPGRGWVFRQGQGGSDFGAVVTSGWITNNGTWQSNGSMRAPIFYDSNDTGYYLNPNGSSLLYGIVLSGNMYFRPNTWIQMDGSYGMYWPNNYGAHFYPNAGSTYTQLQIDGQKNGYSGMHISHSGVQGMMYDGSGNGGVYREASGRWYWYYLLANDCMGIGTSATSSSYSLYLTKGVFAQSRIDATIYYDTNDTGYYCDPNGTSQFSTINANGTLNCTNGGGYSAFMYGNGNTGSVAGIGMNVYSTGGNGAVMAFHRGGYYAVNFGLDSDNVMRIGGWSAGANRWQLDMSGNMTAAGNVTAYSDERLKKDWALLPDDFLHRLAQVKSGTYTRIDSDERQVGVSAQGLQEFLEEAVQTDADGMLSVNYGGAALASAVELAKYVTALEQRISQLEKALRHE